MARHDITLIAGDGIGPEVTGAVVTILEAAGLQANWDAHLAGVLALERHGETLPKALLDSIRRTKVALKGPVTTPVGGGFTSVNVGLRKALDLFANLRPVWNIPGVPSRYTGVDLVIVRENTEDLYAGPRARSRARRGGEPEDHHRRRVHPHRPLRLRARAPPRAPRG